MAATDSHPLSARSRAAVWHPCTQMQALETWPPVAITRAQGAWLFGEDGRRYLDAVSSWWVNLFGHGEARIKAAIVQQLEAVEHVMLAGFTHEPVVALSEQLCALTGGALGHAFYASDGASAVEIALKMSFHYWRNQGRTAKTRYVCLEQGYHGETVGALAVTDVPLFRDAYAPLLRAAAALPTPDARRVAPGEDPRTLAERCARALDDYLETHHREIAALIVEPLVQAAAGMATYHPRYLQLARDSCTRHGVHLIADEIAVGFGRTGSFFAYEQAGIEPDFLCLSKGITGGFLPLSVVLTRDHIYRAFYDPDVGRGFLHSHSYTGNALACRAALAVLDIFRDDAVIEANARRAETFTRLCDPLRAHRRTRHFRQCGMIWALDVADAQPGFSRRFHAAALEAELLLRPIGSTVYFMPPYCIDGTDFQLLAERTADLLDQVP